MSTIPKILVTSAGGKTGLPVAMQLLEKGFPVRAFVRRRGARSEALAKAGAEIFEGNQFPLTDMRRRWQAFSVRIRWLPYPTVPPDL